MFWSERETFIISSSDMILANHRNESRNVLFVGLEESEPLDRMSSSPLFIGGSGPYI